MKEGTYEIKSARAGTSLELGGVACFRGWPMRLAEFARQARQQWTISPVTNAGGYPGAPYFKVTLPGLTARWPSRGRQIVIRASFNSGPEQLWRIEGLPDGTWRIMPKSATN